MATYSSNKYLTAYGTEMTANATYIFDYFTSKGWTKNSICAMLGNMQRESTINPGIWQNLDEGNTSLGLGLCQWTPATKLIEWCNSNNLNYLSIDAQCKRIIYELENGLQWIATSDYPESFSEFTQSTKDIEYLVYAFLKNYERAGVEAVSERIDHAEYWFSTLEGGTSANAKIIEDAISWAVGIANDDTHGYDQTNRWGLDYDCSSLIIQAYENAGCPVKTNGATYTGNMESVFVATGFKSITYTAGMELKKGDVLLREEHTAMYIGDGNIVSAHINELGTTTGGATGDQTTHEIDVSSFSSSGSWDIVLRLPATSGGGSGGGTVITRKRKKFNFLLMGRGRRMNA